MASWKGADLSQLSAAPPAQGRPFAYVTGPVPRVLYLGQDAHIHELRLEAGSWKKGDLTALSGAPGAESFPFAYLTGSGPELVPRVVFRADGHIHELRLDGGSWKKADLSDLSGAAPAQGNPAAYVTGSGSRAVPRVVYRSGDGHIHELRLEDDSWKKADLSTLSGAAPASGDPYGYVTGDGTGRVYRIGRAHS